MAHSVPACSCCHKNLDLQGNKPNSELPETTVISVPCGHLFHRTCSEKFFGDEKVVSCKNENCVEDIKKKHMTKVNFETTASPEAPSVAVLEATIDGYKSSTKANRTVIVKLTTENRKLKEQITIKSSQFKNLEKQNSKCVDENKKLQTKNEGYIRTIKKLKLNEMEFEDGQNLPEIRTKHDEYSKTMEKVKKQKSQLESVKKQNLQLIDQNTELQTKNDEYIKNIEELKQQKSQLESVKKQILQLIDQNEKLRTKNEKCNEHVVKLKLKKLQLESVKKQNLQLIDQNKELQTKNDKCNKTIEMLKQQKSQLESVEKQNLRLVDQNKELQTKNDEYIKTIEELKQHKPRLERVEEQNLTSVNQIKELQTKNNEESRKSIEKQQKCMNYTKTIDEIENSTNFKIVNLKKENCDKNCKSESKIEIKKNLNENIARVKMIFDDEKNVGTLSINEMKTDEESDSPKFLSVVPVPGKVKSKKNDYVIIDPTDQAKRDAKFVKLPTSGKLTGLHANQKQDESKVVNEKSDESSLFRRDLEKKSPTFHPFPLDELVTKQQKTMEIQICTPPLSPSPQRTSRNHGAGMTEETKQGEAEGSQIRENDRCNPYTYQHRETKKRTWNEVQGREYDYALERDVKKHEELNSSSPPQENLRPFFLRDRRFGPFSQVVYKGEDAYTSGEYLLLGDGIIYLILRTALQTSEHFLELLKTSPYYFPRQSIRELDCRLAKLPFLPKKVMISIGDIDSTTYDCTYYDLKKALQSLFNTAYQKGVKEIVMIPPVKYSKWSESREDLDFLLGIKASTAYDWKYYYMQELSEIMSKFTVQISHQSFYDISEEDILKLTEKIVKYTTESRDRESEAETSSK